MRCSTDSCALARWPSIGGRALPPPCGGGWFSHAPSPRAIPRGAKPGHCGCVIPMPITRLTLRRCWRPGARVVLRSAVRAHVTGRPVQATRDVQRRRRLLVSGERPPSPVRAVYRSFSRARSRPHVLGGCVRALRASMVGAGGRSPPGAAPVALCDSSLPDFERPRRSVAATTGIDPMIYSAAVAPTGQGIAIAVRRAVRPDVSWSITLSM